MTDRYDETTTEDLSEATPVCPGCFGPVEPETDFCPHCGAPLGATTWLDPLKQVRFYGYVFKRAGDSRFGRLLVGALIALFALAFLGSAVNGTMQYFGYDTGTSYGFPGMLPVGIGVAILYLLVFRSALMKRDTSEPTGDDAQAEGGIDRE